MGIKLFTFRTTAVLLIMGLVGQFLLGNSPASEFYMPTFRNTVPSSYLPAYEDGSECSETSVYKIEAPGNYLEGSIQHSEHGESFKPRMGPVICLLKIIGSVRCLSERMLPKYYYVIQVIVSVYFVRDQDLF